LAGRDALVAGKAARVGELMTHGHPAEGGAPYVCNFFRWPDPTE
jgi:hypothetical protein